VPLPAGVPAVTRPGSLSRHDYGRDRLVKNHRAVACSERPHAANRWCHCELRGDLPVTSNGWHQDPRSVGCAWCADYAGGFDPEPCPEHQAT